MAARANANSKKMRGAMSLEPDEGQLKIEADRLRERMRTLPETLQIKDCVVASYPAEAYRPKPYLRKMMTETQYRDLGIILNDLYALNEEHVGESILEVGVYFSLTGVHEALEDLMISWTRSYLAARVSKHNPKDGDDEFQRFNRLLCEYFDVFACPDDSLGHLVTAMGKRYAAHLIFEHTLQRVLVFEDTGNGIQVKPSVPFHRKQFEFLGSLMQSLQSQFGRDDSRAFYRIVLANGIPDELRAKLKMPKETLRSSINRMGEDIVTMRQLLIRDFAPDSTIISVSRDLVFAVQWAAHYGIMNLRFAETEDKLLGALATHGGRILLLARDGALLDADRPWIRMENIPPIAEVSGLAVNAYILELIYEKLLYFYDKVDETRFRYLAASEVVREKEADEVVAWSCQELVAKASVVAETPVQQEPEPLPCANAPGTAWADAVPDVVLAEPAKEMPADEQSQWPSGVPATKERPREQARKIHQLRLQTFLHVLQHRLGCEVRAGKGDETTIYRQGGRIFCIGRPAQIHPLVVKQALRRLNISIPEWLKAVGC
jgi:hypothetical protein